MLSVGQRERLTQQRVLAFLWDALGYAYLGYWKDRKGNANVRWCHLIERHHTERFREILDALMPTWRLFRDELNRVPLTQFPRRFSHPIPGLASLSGPEPF
jgi:hypothetical protein